MTGIEKRELERQRYWQGQLLRSADFNDLLAVEDQRRWWHNRALHDAYGVVWGFEISIETNTIGPGVAYDCFGRELQLSADLPIPPTSGLLQDVEWTLLIALRGSGCPSRPKLFWKRTRSVTLTDGVPVAHWMGEFPDEDDRLPRQRRWSRPRIAHGTTPAGNTSWQLLRESDSRPIGVAIVKAAIDATSAGFTKTPRYFATVRHAHLATGIVSDATTAGFTLTAVVPFIVQLGAAEPAGVPKSPIFATALRFLLQAKTDDVVQAVREQLWVHWMGVKHPALIQNDGKGVRP